jgi:hypothetical protein
MPVRPSTSTSVSHCERSAPALPSACRPRDDLSPNRRLASSAAGPHVGGHRR